MKHLYYKTAILAQNKYIYLFTCNFFHFSDG